MGRHTPRRVVTALYTKPPWMHVLVRICEKWERAYVLRQADSTGHCLVSVRESDPIMVPLSTIRIPSRRRFAKKTMDTRPYRPIKKPRDAVEGQEQERSMNGSVEVQRVAMGDASAGSSTPLALLGAPHQVAGLSSSGHNRHHDGAGV